MNASLTLQWPEILEEIIRSIRKNPSLLAGLLAPNSELERTYDEASMQEARRRRDIPDDWDMACFDGRPFWRCMQLAGRESMVHWFIEAERSFALAFGKYASLVSQSMETSTAYAIQIMIASEDHKTDDVTMWWTIAPYLYDLLLRPPFAVSTEGMSVECNALRKLLLWAITGYSRLREVPDEIARPWQKVYLQWLGQIMEDAGLPKFTLRENEDDISHTLARALAWKVALSIQKGQTHISHIIEHTGSAAVAAQQ